MYDGLKINIRGRLPQKENEKNLKLFSHKNKLHWHMQQDHGKQK